MTVVINGTTYIAVGDLWLINWAFRRVADIMQTSDDEMVVSPDLSAMQALERMLALGAERLVVVHDGQLLGLVTRASIGHFIEQRHPSGLSASS